MSALKNFVGLLAILSFASAAPANRALDELINDVQSYPIEHDDSLDDALSDEVDGILAELQDTQRKDEEYKNDLGQRMGRITGKISEFKRMIKNQQKSLIKEREDEARRRDSSGNKGGSGLRRADVDYEVVPSFHDEKKESLAPKLVNDLQKLSKHTKELKDSMQKLSKLDGIQEKLQNTDDEDVASLDTDELDEQIQNDLRSMHQDRSRGMDLKDITEDASEKSSEMSNEKLKKRVSSLMENIDFLNDQLDAISVKAEELNDGPPGPIILNGASSDQNGKSDSDVSSEVAALQDETGDLYEQLMDVEDKLDESIEDEEEKKDEEQTSEETVIYPIEHKDSKSGELINKLEKISKDMKALKDKAHKYSQDLKTEKQENVKDEDADELDEQTLTDITEDASENKIQKDVSSIIENLDSLNDQLDTISYQVEDLKDDVPSAIILNGASSDQNDVNGVISALSSHITDFQDKAGDLYDEVMDVEGKLDESIEDEEEKEDEEENEDEQQTSEEIKEEKEDFKSSKLMNGLQKLSEDMEALKDTMQNLKAGVSTEDIDSDEDKFDDDETSFNAGASLQHLDELRKKLDDASEKLFKV